MYKENGLKTMTKGLPSTYINNMKLGAQFVLYDEIKDRTNNIFLASMMSKLVSSTIFYPLDLIRVNQRNATGKLTIKDAVQKVYKNGGLRGFYRGVTLYNAVSTPNFVLMIMFKELFDNAINKH